MDKTIRQSLSLGRELCLYFCVRTHCRFPLVPVARSQQPGGFSFAECDAVFPLFPSSTCVWGWWNLFLRNSLWLLAAQYPPNGFTDKGLRKCSLCSADGHSQNGCCLMPPCVSSTCPPAKSFLVDRGKKMSSFMFLCVWSPFYHSVAGEENRNSSLGSRTLQSHYQLEKLWPMLDFKRDLCATL